MICSIALTRLGFVGHGAKPPSPSGVTIWHGVKLEEDRHRELWRQAPRRRSRRWPRNIQVIWPSPSSPFLYLFPVSFSFLWRGIPIVLATIGPPTLASCLPGHPPPPAFLLPHRPRSPVHLVGSTCRTGRLTSYRTTPCRGCAEAVVPWQG